MFLRTNQWERAHELAKSFMNENDISNMYVTRARDLETAGMQRLTKRQAERCRKTLSDNGRT